MFRVKNSSNTIVSQLKVASDAYYKGSPIMSDSEFDALEDSLRKQDPNNSWFSNITRESAEYGKKVQHKYCQIGSVDKIRSLTESRLRKSTDACSISLKLDGSSMVVYYTNGQVDYAATRGDGTYGMDVTSKYNKIVEKYNITIPKDFCGSIRGEVVMSQKNWLSYKSIYGDAKMARNVGTGLLNRKEVSDELQYVDYVVYDVIASNSDETLKTSNLQDSNWNTLDMFGYPVCPHISNVMLSSLTEDNLKTLYEQWCELFPADGMVFEYRTGITEQFDSFGSHYITRINEAYKFPAEEKETTVTSIEWNLTRTGKLVPTVCVEPVFLSGATVSRASGYNVKFIESMNIVPGCRVSIRRSNEVIPEIRSVVEPSCNKMEIPVVCPKCGAQLSRTATGVDLICTNASCEGGAYNKLSYFIKCVCEDVKGVGDVYVEHFIECMPEKTILGVLHTAKKMCKDDSYSHYLIESLGTAEKCLTLEHVRNKLNVQNLDAYNFFVALGIPMFGQVMSRDLCSDSDTLRDIIVSLREKDSHKVQNTLLRKFPGKVEMTNKFLSYLDFLSTLIQDDLFNDIEQVWCKSKTQYRLYAVTGSVSLPRKQFEQKMQTLGWAMTDNVTKAEVLINNDNTSNSSKNVKAKNAGIPIVTEQQFEQIYVEGNK